MTTVEPAFEAEAESLGMIFEEPPARVGPQGKPSIWTPRLAFLREYPGVWAKFEGKTDAAKHQIKKTDEDWSVTRRVIEGAHFVFVRYNGPSV